MSLQNLIEKIVHHGEVEIPTITPRTLPESSAQNPLIRTTEIIGEGGMSKVYVGEFNGKKVAIKVPLLLRDGNEELVLHTFEEELSFLRQHQGETSQFNMAELGIPFNSDLSTYDTTVSVAVGFATPINEAMPEKFDPKVGIVTDYVGGKQLFSTRTSRSGDEVMSINNEIPLKFQLAAIIGWVRVLSQLTQSGIIAMDNNIDTDLLLDIDTSQSGHRHGSHVNLNITRIDTTIASSPSESYDQLIEIIQACFGKSSNALSATALAPFGDYLRQEFDHGNIKTIIDFERKIKEGLAMVDWQHPELNSVELIKMRKLMRE